MENRLTAYETFQRTNQGEGRADAGTERTFPGGICTGEDSGQCGTGFPWCCGIGQKPEWESCKACKGKTAAKKRGKTDTERIKRGTHSGTGRASFFFSVRRRKRLPAERADDKNSTVAGGTEKGCRKQPKASSEKDSTDCPYSGTERKRY